MSKTITLRIDDDSYSILKTAAEAEKRTISNYIEYAAVAHLTDTSFVSDDEMKDLLTDKQLMKSIHKALGDAGKGRYRIVK